jgi:hypothetical protein
MMPNDHDAGEDAVTEVATEPGVPDAPKGWLSRVGSDWWATILGLVIAALAVAGALPKIPW